MKIEFGSRPKISLHDWIKSRKRRINRESDQTFFFTIEKDYTLAQIKLSAYFEKSNEEKDNHKARIIYKRLSRKTPNAALKLGWMFENNFEVKKIIQVLLNFIKLCIKRRK